MKVKRWCEAVGSPPAERIKADRLLTKILIRFTNRDDQRICAFHYLNDWLWQKSRSVDANAGNCERCPLKCTVPARSPDLCSPPRAVGAPCAHV